MLVSIGISGSRVLLLEIFIPLLEFAFALNRFVFVFLMTYFYDNWVRDLVSYNLYLERDVRQKLLPAFVDIRGKQRRQNETK